MSDELFRNKYRNDTARATWHDYNGGEYFITICTKKREHHFGEIFDGAMQLSVLGEYAEQCIKQIPMHNLYAQVPLFVIMPNHIHLIVMIDKNMEEIPVGTCHGASLQMNKKSWRKTMNDKNENMQKIANFQGRLSTMIGGFKQSITRYARQHRIPFAWQTRFYDHIIRNRNEMNRIAKYIENNVAKWEYDELF